MTDVSFDPFARLCNAQIIKLRTDALDVISADFQLDDNTRFWATVAYAIEYATRADRHCVSGLQAKIFKELDIAASYRAFDQDLEANHPHCILIPHSTAWTSYPHWSSTREGKCQCRSFFDFAVRCQFTGYIRYILKTSPPTIEQLTYALLIAVVEFEGLSPGFEDRPTVQAKGPNPDLIKLLLEHSADPNANFYGVLRNVSNLPDRYSPWRVFTMPKTRMPEFQTIARSFMQHGAGPKVVGMDMLHRSPHGLTHVETKEKKSIFKRFSAILKDRN